MKEFTVKILKEGNVIDATIYYDESSSQVKLTYKLNDDVETGEDMYPFFALLKIRAKLEESGIFILCNGARKDVYPSGSSAIGIMAYELEMGKQATRLVSIFGEVDAKSKIGTVDEQKKYREEWLKSLKH